MIAIDYTQDGTIDLKGKSVQRSKTGCWKACSFLVGNISFSHTIVIIFIIYMSCHIILSIF
jgi:peptide/histidine transporter 3/4